jgi:manganese/zinc/iron transport system permease protein
MSPWISIDLPALFAALLALAACGSTGHWLVLRRQALAGDAIAHAVLPGLVGGFLVTGTRSPLAMLAGAAIAGVATVLLAELAQRRARTDRATALGIVFTAAFALGIALLETQGARQVDLDPSCVLFGSLETIFAVPAPEATGVAAWLRALPREVWSVLAACIATLVLSTAFRRELAALAFDRGFARTSGASPRWLENALLAVTSMAIVASFEAVGSVLVLALLCCPTLLAAPFARHSMQRLWLGLVLSALVATPAYFLAAHAPAVLGARTALNASGMIAVALAAAVALAHLGARLVSRRPA